MKQSTKSTLQRIIKEEIARQLQNNHRRLIEEEIPKAKFKVGDVVKAGTEGKRKIVAVYQDSVAAEDAAMAAKEWDLIEPALDMMAARPRKYDDYAPWYKMDGEGYYYHEADLKA